MSDSWLFEEYRTIIRNGNFITSTTSYYTLACEAEICRFLESLKSIDKLFDDKNDVTKRNLRVASDYLELI